MQNLISIVTKLMTAFHVRLHLDMGGQKGVKITNMGQNCQKFKISQKNVLQFPEASDHIWMYLICQTKSPILTDKWIKGC